MGYIFPRRLTSGIVAEYYTVKKRPANGRLPKCPERNDISQAYSP